MAWGQPYYTERVLRGDRRPPRNGTDTHDSVVANPGPMQGHQAGQQNHQEFVIFDVAQAYPAYVVEYELV